MDKKRKIEIDEILKKTEEDIKNGNYNINDGIPLDEFLKIQKEKRKLRNS